MGIALQTMTNELTHVFLLSVGAFLLAMFLTPIYTFFAYRYRFWKRQRSESTDGKKLKVFAKFQAAKLRRNIPTMAGVIGVISIFVVTILVPGFNNLFHVSHLSLTQWMVVAVGALMIVVLVEIVKAIQRALGKDKNAI